MIAVSEPTRFCVTMEAAPYALMPERFCGALFAALIDQGIPAEPAAAEVAAMAPMQVTTSNSPSVLSFTEPLRLAGGLLDLN